VIRLVMHQFILQGAEEALRHRVVTPGGTCRGASRPRYSIR
jgi:hypothetical protein